MLLLLIFLTTSNLRSSNFYVRWETVPSKLLGSRLWEFFKRNRDTVLFLKEKERKGNMKSLATSTQERTFCLYWEKVGDAKVKVSCLFLLSPLLGMTAHSWQSLCFLGTSILRREESDNDAPSQRDCRPWWQLDQTEHPCPTFRSKEHSR